MGLVSFYERLTVAAEPCGCASCLPGAMYRFVGWLFVLATLAVNTAAAPAAPGQPASITNADCELLRQIKDDLLAALPDRVLDFNLACEAPATRWPFGVSVQTLTPVAGQARVASTG